MSARDAFARGRWGAQPEVLARLAWGVVRGVARCIGAGAVSALAVFACGGAAAAAGSAASGQPVGAPLATAGGPAASSFHRHLADLRLTDQNGRPWGVSALQGQLLLVNFVYTGCATVCSPQTAELAAVRRALPLGARERVRFLSVSLDPMGDTPAVLRDFAQRLGADQPGWDFVGAPQADIDRLIERLDLLDRRKAKPQLADHRTALWLVDGQGRVRQRYAGVPVDRPRLVRELQALANLEQR